MLLHLLEAVLTLHSECYALDFLDIPETIVPEVIERTIELADKIDAVICITKNY